MSDRSVKRIYVGNLPAGVDEREVQREFEKCGKISKLDVKQTVSGVLFAFIEYSDSRDAEDALRDKNGIEFHGARLRVEIPFKDRDGGRGRSWRGRGQPPRKGKYIIEVLGLPPTGSWQDLKDHMREVGECGHADVFKDGMGEVSFFTRRDMENAIDKFDGSSFRSHEGEKARISVREKVSGFSVERNGHFASRSLSYDPRDYRDRYSGRYDRKHYSRDRYDDRRRSYSRSPEYERGKRSSYYRSRSRSVSRSYDR